MPDHDLYNPSTTELQSVGDMDSAANLDTLDLLGWEPNDEITGKPIWVSSDGKTTAWTEVIGGVAVLAIGDSDGAAHDYISTLAAVCLAVEQSRSA